MRRSGGCVPCLRFATCWLCEANGRYIICMRLFRAVLGIAATVEDDGTRDGCGRVARDVELKMPSRMEQFRGSCDAARSRVVGIRALRAI
jgi:hypothetical protein